MIARTFLLTHPPHDSLSDAGDAAAGGMDAALG
jgi:hypothetical protein